MRNPIAEARRQRGLSQAKLALLIGVSLPAICAAEAGAVARPRKLLDSMARLGLDSSELAARYDAWLNFRRGELAQAAAL